MAYSYVSARVLPNVIGAQWQELDISEILVSVLFSKYRAIFLTLIKDGERVYVDFDQLKAEYASYPNTINVLLLSIGGRILDTVEQLPGGKNNYVTYRDAVSVGYSVQLDKRGVQYPENFPKAELTDLRMVRTKYNTDMRLIHSHCLISINGFYHRTDSDGENLFIVDGGISVRKKNIGHTGILSFYDIGAVKKLGINKDSMVPLPSHTHLKESVVFTIPESTDGKSVLLCLGGYLVFPDANTFWKVSDHEYAVNLNFLPYLERILESGEFIDLGPLGLSASSINPANVNVDEIWSDEVIKRYFTLSQSFFIIVDTKSLFWNKLTIRQSLIPGSFVAYEDPTYPLVVGHGRTAEYWKIYEHPYWSVTVMDSWYRNYIFNRQPEDTLVNVTNQLAMDRPFFYSQGQLLEIGAASS